tara:strand:+ start:2640 stop:2933 length:294 start_codon:yes stop_codon:yes gene_type:complete
MSPTTSVTVVAQTITFLEEIRATKASVTEKKRPQIKTTSTPPGEKMSNKTLMQCSQGAPTIGFLKKPKPRAKRKIPTISHFLTRKMRHRKIKVKVVT